MNTKTIGDNGETAACLYLEKKGYNIKKRNYHTRYGEIDIIAGIDEYTVFVEVKTRKSIKYGTPAEYVTMSKQNKIIKSAYCYLGENSCAVRFDIIEILYNGDKMYINHIENAFWEE